MYRFAIAITSRMTLLMKEVLGVKWISSPKHPQDSILPMTVGKNRFTPVRNTKNDSMATKANAESIGIIRSIAIKPAIISATQTSNAISKEKSRTHSPIYASPYCCTSCSKARRLKILSHPDNRKHTANMYRITVLMPMYSY